MSSICHRCGKEFPDEDFITETGRKSVECNKCRGRRKKYKKKPEENLDKTLVPELPVDPSTNVSIAPTMVSIPEPVKENPEKTAIQEISETTTSLTAVKFVGKDKEKSVLLNFLYFKSKTFQPFIVVIERKVSTLEIVDFAVKHAKGLKYELDFLQKNLKSFEIEPISEIHIEENPSFMNGFLTGLSCKWQLNGSYTITEDFEKVLKFLLGFETYKKDCGDFTNY